jgi:hypothetical protein
MSCDQGNILSMQRIQLGRLQSAAINIPFLEVEEKCHCLWLRKKCSNGAKEQQSEDLQRIDLLYSS